MPKKNETAPAWRSRIVGHGAEAPDQLLANPNNWRIHPRAQQQALEGALNEIGWLKDVVVNQRSGHVVDGHARIAMAISRGETSVPVVYVDLDENEERIALLSFDSLALMATRDQGMLDALAQQTEVQDAALRALIENMATQAEVEPSEKQTPSQAVREVMTVTCPDCGHDFKPERPDA